MYATVGGPGTNTPTRVDFSDVTLRDLIRATFPVLPHEIVGIPDWSTDRYDISARIPAESRWQDVNLMLRSLLMERFKLRTHLESRDMPTYVLEPTRQGFKAAKASADDAGYSREVASLRGFWVRNAVLSLPDFALMLSRRIGRRVIDKTGLPGKYEITVRFRNPQRELHKTATEDEYPSVFTALPEQLGLRLREARGLTDVVVIDHLERVPLAN
jgi:uncharacterized protein (TIGR03435 family)